MKRPRPSIYNKNLRRESYETREEREETERRDDERFRKAAGERATYTACLTCDNGRILEPGDKCASCGRIKR